MNDSEKYKNLIKNTVEVKAFWQVNKHIASYVGGMPALFLAELISKDNYHEGEKIDGKYFYHKSKSIEDTLYITPDQRREYMKILINAGFISIKKMGMPAKYYFEIKYNNIITIMEDKNKGSKEIRKNNKPIKLKKKKNTDIEFSRLQENPKSRVMEFQPKSLEIPTTRVMENDTTIYNNKDKIKINENKPSEPNLTNIITRDEELMGNTLGVGSMLNSNIKENIYKYLHSKDIPINPGSDEQAIEKHKYSPEFVYKIQRLEKLHFIVKNWRDFQNKLDPKVHIPKLLELETSPGTISWVLSNYSTDVDPYYNLIESFVRRREEERRHKQAEEERKEAERQEYYATLRENQTFEQPDNRTVYEKLEEKRKEREQDREPKRAIEEELKTERLTPEEQIRLRDLMIRGRMSLEEQLEYKSLIERNRK